MKTNDSKLSQKELKEILHYNQQAGIFTWKMVSKYTKIKIGDIAGYKRPDNYVYIGINKKHYLAHRLAWLYIKGYWPEYEIDHIDRCKSNNKWNNLRHVSRRCNIRNCRVYKNNKSGVKGVSWYKPTNKWGSHVTVNNKVIYLGRYKNLTKAVYHRWKAEIKYNFSNCNSTSSAYLYLKNKGLVK